MIMGGLIPAALANHVWQSTLFGVAAALLALALRKNRAQTRYLLWLIASLKFLIPFSLLIAAGSHLQWPATAPLVHPAVSTAVQQIGQPFATSSEHFDFFLNANAPITVNPLQPVLLTIWLGGFTVVLFSWFQGWLRVRSMVRAATPVPIEAPIRVLSSPFLMEPGVFGIFQPVLLLPAGISRHLAPAHLEAILAHELCHARRRDNFFAALHMLVEAIFWFHPLVWWIGARLMEEREHACDEEVLRLGNQPNVYAESIVRTCQFCLEPPAACIAGVTGADLKKRIVRIMTQPFAARLDLRKKLLLLTAGVAAVGLPLAIGTQSSPEKGPEFEVASVKPTKSGAQQGFFIRMEPGARFNATGITPKFLIEQAYDIKDSQISGAPSWIDAERYDIDAKPDEAEAAKFDKLPPDQRGQELRKMLQALLADRFQLKLGHETKDLPVYELVVMKNGPKFHESTFKPADKLPDLPPAPPGSEGPQRLHGGEGIMMNGRGELTVTDVQLSMFANVLSHIVGRIVVDKTGLAGKYDFTLKYTPDEGQGPMMPGGPRPGSDGAAPPPESAGPSIFTALQEQLGLKLESQKAPTDVLVVEHVERPSAN